MRRFLSDRKTVIDTRTNLMWTKDAALFEFPLTWKEALTSIQSQNTLTLYGYSDWRLPSRKELFSLVSFKVINPGLPTGHPFLNVFNGYYWTSSSCIRLPRQAWYIHLGGARVFKGMKHGSYMVWPVRTSENQKLVDVMKTGQRSCFNENGVAVDCQGTGQDGDIQSGIAHPDNRFVEESQVVHDRSTGLTWMKSADICKEPVTWTSALSLVSEMNAGKEFGYNDWRVPNVVELESLTDLGRHSPALPVDHPFDDVRDYYWSATTSMYDADYAWVLYFIDGAVGVGYKPLSEFYLWPVSGQERLNH